MENKEIPSAKDCAIHGVTEEIKYFVSLVGIGFHPDTDFEEYLNYRGTKPRFGKRLIKTLNARLDECFDMCKKYDLDIYGISMEVVKPLINE